MAPPVNPTLVVAAGVVAVRVVRRAARAARVLGRRVGREVLGLEHAHAARGFTFVFAWNDFLFSLVLTRIEVITYTVQVTHYFGGESNFWAKIAAMSVLGTLPIFVVVAFMQRYLVRGIALGAVKA